MPTYTYKREDGSIFDVEQRITEDPLEVCPTTGQKVKRVISGSAGLVFKGSGFYLTDYVKSGGGDKSKSSEKEGATSSKSSENGKSESKSENTDGKKKAASPSSEKE